MRGNSLDLSIECQFHQVPGAGREVNRFCQSLSMSHEESSQVELCVVEALNNVIKHGHGGDGRDRVTLKCCTTDGFLVIEITDRGLAMDPGKIEEIDVSAIAPGKQCVSDLPERGRGLVIMKSVMDDLSYVTGEDGNCLRMAKKLGTGI